MSADALVLQGCRYRVRWARDLPVWDVRLRPGAAAHLHAPNGTGKSTFLRAAVGLVPAAWDLRSGGVPARAGGLPRGGVLPLRYVASGAGVSAGLRLGHQAELAAERYGLGALPADRLEQWGVADLAGRRGDELSHGEHRAAVLAVALAGTPEVVVLDEPSVALDIERQDLLIADLHRVLGAGAAVVIASHDRWLIQDVPGTVIDFRDQPSTGSPRRWAHRRRGA